MSTDRPITILICALGGEGGGVLSEWLVDAAAKGGFAAQSTSIPGVAQRTGATTYYVEIFPLPLAQLGPRRPVFSLYPVPGALDLLVSSELLETVRQIGNGMASAERTTIVTSLARTLTTNERMQQADGRMDNEALLGIVQRFAREARVLDMAAMTREAGTVVSAVMFGAIAGSGLLPFGRPEYEAVIRAAGRGAAASLAGFALAFERVANDRQRLAWVEQVLSADAAGAANTAPIPQRAATLPPTIAKQFPAEALPMLRLGHARVVEYQDDAYGALYLERMARVLDAEQRRDPARAHGCAITIEAARYLALWMAFDDIVRVAELKSRASRAARVRREVKPGPNDVLRIYDHFKPGMPEIAALLPARIGDRLLRWDRRRQQRGKAAWGLPLKLPTHAVTGMLALRALGGLKGMRRRGARFAAEQALIERWLRAVVAGTDQGWPLGHELALSGRLIKGYGNTNERGKENLLHIVDHLASAGESADPLGERRTATRADDDANARKSDDVHVRSAAIRAARIAALADENGVALDRTLVAHGAPPRPVKPVPIRFVRKTAGVRG